ncbi:MAG TPA: DUF4178 domain-containing protein [Gemmatimonadaceae bacterium]|nr:DUF4178 domain-containing protein [Gemmatimonadaceae bacterium]
MTSAGATCPNCGAPVTFAWAGAVQTSCPFCKSLLVRSDVDLRKVGTVGDFPATSSPLQVGTTGAFEHRRFTVVGRVVYAYDRGSWNEWCLHMSDGTGAWLSDARGDYGFSTPVAGHDVPAQSQLKVGANFAWDGRIYKLTAVIAARIRAVEGDLPFTTWNRTDAVLAELDANDGHFATLDFRELPPVLMLGTWTEFDALQLDNLREVDGWRRPA